MSALNYRKDIDGLRAIAVLSVIICHANPLWLPGGFVGVDIFFVISGFLITSIIYQEMQAGTFSFARFYQRRIKRILPVFFLVLFAVMAVGSILLLPNDLLFLMKSARYAALFASNIHFAGAIDYFAPATVEAPLIHTWSLAVEEQYYFVWPVMLMLILRFARQYLLPIALLLCMASFALASVLAHDNNWAMWSFYQLPARMGELLVGSMLAFYKPLARPGDALAKIASLLGMGLILLSFGLLDKTSVFPGYNALWPCLGAALLIYAGSGNFAPSPVQRLLSSKPVVFVGKISYSLYLWHWPVLAFARYYTMQETLPLAWVLASFLLTLLLSVLSWKYVEQPVRQQKLGFPAAAKRYFLVPAIVVLVVAAAVKHADGLVVGNDDPKLNNIVLHDIGCVYELKPDCRIGAKVNKARTVMFGDSHAKHFSLVFDGIAKKQGFAIDFFSANSCPFMLDKEFNKGERCTKLSGYVSSNLANYDNVIIVLRWDQHFPMPGKGSVEANDFELHLRQLASDWVAQGKKVFLVAQVPEYQKDIQRAYRLGNTDNRVDGKYHAANIRLQTFAAGQQGVYYVGFDPILLSWNNGLVDRLPAYLDAHHLNQYGQEKLLERILADESYLWLMDELQVKAKGHESL